MSDYLEPMDLTLQGDWWTTAAAFVHLAARLDTTYGPLPSGSHTSDGYRVLVLGGPPWGGTLGTFIFRGSGGRTQITVEQVPAEREGYVTTVLGQLRQFAEDAQRLRREAKPTADEAIERYYRSRAAGSKKTLRQIATETTYSYDYLRNVKRAYDKAGKWGSKKERAHSLQTGE